MVPKALYAVISPKYNPHANADVEVFTQRRKAQRACTWGGQKVVVYVPDFSRCPGCGLLKTDCMQHAKGGCCA